jgi:hypothetical protein
MKSALPLIGLLVIAFVMVSPISVSAHPAHYQSIDWATANSDRVIVGKVIKVETVDKHDIVTVEVHRTLRGDREAKGKTTFIVQQYCSGYAQGWLEDGLPMLFFLVKIDGAKPFDQLPKGFQWISHADGNGNSTVALGKTKRVWPGTMDVFTRKFDYLTDPAGVVKYVNDYARSIPAIRIEEKDTVRSRIARLHTTGCFHPNTRGMHFTSMSPWLKKSSGLYKRDVRKMKTERRIGMTFCRLHSEHLGFSF